ncbi:MAG: type IV pilin N-terminal domain-containing protein [Halobacteria archaeon]|nr:type IV pilin N-terminal domain-containing protein [Halobacteria archaeon]
MIRRRRLKQDRGVSPVIGVVLMVAITVIIAAAVGVTFIQVGGEEINQNAQAGVSIEERGGSVNIRLITAPRADSIYVRYTKSGTSKIDSTWAPVGSSDIGDTINLKPDSRTTVTVVGEYDGSNSTIRSYEVG